MPGGLTCDNTWAIEIPKNSSCGEDSKPIQLECTMVAIVHQIELSENKMQLSRTVLQLVLSVTIVHVFWP